MGANAETERYLPGFFSATMSAPWPPMLWPNTDARSTSTFTPSMVANVALSTAGSSCVT